MTINGACSPPPVTADIDQPFTVLNESAPQGTQFASGSRQAVETLEVAVTRLGRIADDIVEVVFELSHAEQTFPEWQPGAHIDLALSNGLRRQYSLCGDIADRTSWRIAVLRQTNLDGGSRFIHEQLRAGDKLQLRGPANHFPLSPAPSYAFVAGGIGITPILPMLHQVNAAGLPWSLAYGGRSMTSMAFVEELSHFPGNVTFWPQDTAGVIDLERVIEGAEAETHIYCCGPGGLINAVTQRCAQRRSGSLHIERFQPAEIPSADNTAFEVYLEYSALSVAVGEDQTIVDALTDAGIDVPTSCRKGTCGTCETTVLEGLPDHRDSVLTEADRMSNETMMICCSRSRSPRLVLDL